MGSRGTGEGVGGFEEQGNRHDYSGGGEQKERAGGCWGGWVLPGYLSANFELSSIRKPLPCGVNVRLWNTIANRPPCGVFSMDSLDLLSITSDLLNRWLIGVVLGLQLLYRSNDIICFWLADYRFLLLLVLSIVVVSCCSGSWNFSLKTAW